MTPAASWNDLVAHRGAGRDSYARAGGLMQMSAPLTARPRGGCGRSTNRLR
jgi:hypothetical protein